jgi:hypothetical protein
MKSKEILHITMAIIVLALVIGFNSLIELDSIGFGIAILFAAIMIIINVSAKKIMGRWLDAGVENTTWLWSRYGWKPGWHTKKPIPVGVILPIFVTAFSLGTVKLMTILTYETTALKRRAARKFGHYSFTEMTEWHNSLIGATGILLMLILSFVSYWIPNLEPLARFAAFYAFFNMIPISKLDGMQIYMGSRLLWYTLAIITLIFASYAVLLA